MKSGQLRAGRLAHVTRNPMPVSVLADAEIMRDEGEGVARVFRKIAASLLREPEIESSGGLFRMTLFNEPVTKAMRPGWSHLQGALPISDGQRRMLLTRPSGFTAGDYQKINGTSEDEAMRLLRDLREKGIAERGSGGAGSPPSFSVVPALETDAWFLDTKIPHLREYFSRKPTLQDADYRVLFEVDRHNALRELRRLVTLGVLMARGTRRSTRYELAITRG